MRRTALLRCSYPRTRPPCSLQPRPWPPPPTLGVRCWAPRCVRRHDAALAPAAAPLPPSLLLIPVRRRTLPRRCRSLCLPGSWWHRRGRLRCLRGHFRAARISSGSWISKPPVRWRNEREEKELGTDGGRLDPGMGLAVGEERAVTRKPHGAGSSPALGERLIRPFDPGHAPSVRPALVSQAPNSNQATKHLKTSKKKT